MNASKIALSQRLREGTKAAHQAVEEIAFLRSFLRGVVDREAYRRYLIDLEHVYAHLERGLLSNAEHPILQPLVLPQLWRRKSLRADIIFLSTQAMVIPSPSASARRYADWLTHLALRRPELLVAHAYTRYMGDLSGGPVLRRIAARALQLDDRGGLSFYAFPQIADLKTFKQSYRARLDGLPVDDALAEVIVEEAVHAFVRNGEVLDERTGSAVLGMWNVLVQPASRARGFI